MTHTKIVNGDVILQKLGRAVLLLSSNEWSGLADEQDDRVTHIVDGIKEGDPFTLEMRAYLMEYSIASHVFGLISLYVRDMV